MSIEAIQYECSDTLLLLLHLHAAWEQQSMNGEEWNNL